MLMSLGESTAAQEGRAKANTVKILERQTYGFRDAAGDSQPDRDSREKFGRKKIREEKNHKKEDPTARYCKVVKEVPKLQSNFFQR